MGIGSSFLELFHLVFIPALLTKSQETYMSYLFIRADFSPSKLKGQEDEKGFLKDDELGSDFYEDLQRKKPRSKAFMEPECPCCRNLSKRYTIALLSSLGFVISFGIRCNLSTAMVKMVEPVDGKPPEFNWTPGIIGVMDSSFFWGYLLTNIPGGFLATKYPANRVFGSAIAISAGLNFLIPKSAEIHASAVMFVRVLQGLVEILVLVKLNLE
ncbi:vesicular glutamate transporter 3 [Nephila pilipes]|uniref:Vesicular glutamate transporter 3 n=1 Tax=Nephila pilipes TaxID=299642 RepID=A0A8X6P5G5_NEPPI|nr:vesicular glutamate transporter 3 [Nephila pilipes]